MVHNEKILARVHSVVLFGRLWQQVYSSFRKRLTIEKYIDFKTEYAPPHTLNSVLNTGIFFLMR